MNEVGEQIELQNNLLRNAWIIWLIVSPLAILFWVVVKRLATSLRWKIILRKKHWIEVSLYFFLGSTCCLLLLLTLEYIMLGFMLMAVAVFYKSLHNMAQGIFLNGQYDFQPGMYFSNNRLSGHIQRIGLLGIVLEGEHLNQRNIIHYAQIAQDTFTLSPKAPDGEVSVLKLALNRAEELTEQTIVQHILALSGIKPTETFEIISAYQDGVQEIQVKFHSLSHQEIERIKLPLKKSLSAV